MTARTRRLAFGIGGQALWRLLTAGYSLVVIPFMIRAWGIALYGEWLTLTAFVTYIAASNYGLTAASGMRMIASTARGDFDDANGVFEASLIVGVAFLLLAGGLMTCSFAFFNLRGVFHLEQIDLLSLWIIGAAMYIQVVALTLRGLLFALSNSAGSYALPYTLSSVWRGIEILVTLAGLTIFHTQPATIALIVTTTTTLDMILQTIVVRRTARWARVRLQTRNLHLLRPLFIPSLGHMTINIAVNAVSINGMRLLIGATLGGVAVAVFSVTSTLTRLSEHLINLVLPMIQLEFAGDRSDERQVTRSLLSLSSGFGIIAQLVVSFTLIIFGKSLFGMWTSNQADLNFSLLLLLLVSSFATQLGRPLQSYLMGRNITGSTAIVAIVFSSCGVLVANMLVQPLGLNAVGVGLIVGEVGAWVGMLLLVVRSLDLRLGALVYCQLNLVRSGRRMTELLARVFSSIMRR